MLSIDREQTRLPGLSHIRTEPSLCKPDLASPECWWQTIGVAHSAALHRPLEGLQKLGALLDSRHQSREHLLLG